LTVAVALPYLKPLTGKTPNRLSRMRDRYMHEKSNLDSTERRALAKVFEEDVFIEGLLNIPPNRRTCPNAQGSGHTFNDQ
jgi:hypothetical protein